ncbi:hypothetical protein HY312_01085 [Candidatus Saccharibacteria bacterium]|nr:hypothetical protein [Candidatus Saccharibacteria bacterium]
MILALITGFILTTIGVSLATVAASKYAKTKRDTYVSTANYVAEAGISVTLAKMYDDTSMTGTGYGPETTLFDSIDTGKATYSVRVEPGPSATSRYISSIGKFYNPRSATIPTSIQYVRVVANQNTAPTNYSIFAGPGGIELASGAKLQSFGIYSGGKLTLNGSSTQIGDPTNASKIDVANVTCTQSGTNTRFPYPCTETDKPLRLNGNIIYGQVCANSQTNGAGVLPSAGAPRGLITSCTPLRNAINTINRTTLISGTPSTYTASNASCSNTTKSPVSGTYTGDVTIANCLYGFPALTYIVGDLTITGSIAQSSDLTGAQGSLVIVTGKITIDSTATGYNAANANTRFISFHSSDSTGCSVQPSCASFPDTASGWSAIRNSFSIDAINLTNGGNLFGGEYTAYFGNVAVTGPSGSSNELFSLSREAKRLHDGRNSCCNVHFHACYTLNHISRYFTSGSSEKQ